MIFYYAIGGGLGHLTRAKRVLEKLGLTSEATILTSRDLPPHLEHHPDEHCAWLRERITARDRLIADVFPGGIQGELCDLDIAMDYVARLLKWDEYRRAVPFELPRFETTWIVEELTPEHDAFVRQNSERVLTLDVSPAVGASSISGYWLIVHSGPEHEVRELVEYARELRALAKFAAKVLVATRCAIELPPEFVLLDEYPASHLYANAERIITAAGFNVMIETEPFRDKHTILPFARTFDDQFLRAARRRQCSQTSSR